MSDSAAHRFVAETINKIEYHSKQDQIETMHIIETNASVKPKIVPATIEKIENQIKITDSAAPNESIELNIMLKTKQELGNHLNVTIETVAKSNILKNLPKINKELGNHPNTFETVAKSNILENLPKLKEELGNHPNTVETVAKSNILETIRKNNIKKKLNQTRTKRKSIQSTKSKILSKKKVFRGSSRIILRRTVRKIVNKPIFNTRSKPVKLKKCYVCAKEYTFKKSLFFHILSTHPQEKQFKCTECPQSFFGVYSLRKHMESHSTVIPDPIEQWKNEMIPCKTCGKSYTLENSFMCNSKHHMLEKNHKCVECGEAFYYEIYLKIHTRSHQKDKEIEQTGGSTANRRPVEADLVALAKFRFRKSENECNVCEKLFTNLSALREHKKLRHNPFELKDKLFKKK